MAFNKTRRYFFKTATRFDGHRVFFPKFQLTNFEVSTPCAQRIVYRDNLSAITKYITKAISVIGKSKPF